MIVYSVDIVVNHVPGIYVFEGVEKNATHIFTDWCKENKTVQECPQEDMKKIYPFGTPTDPEFSLAAFFESTLHCSGFNMQLTRYYFTNT